MEQLAEQQELHAEEISNIIRNYKKDSAERKTSVNYFEERLRRLDNAWALFEATDTKIRSAPGPAIDHEYFTSGLYDSTLANYDKFREHFLEKIASLSNKTNPNKPPLEEETHHVDTNKSEAVRKPTTSKQPSELIRLVRRQRGVADSLRRTLSSLDLEGQQYPTEFYELKIKMINQFWNQLENLNHSIWELSDDPVAEGYDIDAYVQLEDVVQNWLIRLTGKLHNLTVGAQNTTTVPTGTSAITNTMLKLPKITLPKFDGDYLKWRQFYDLFVQMVHNQPMVNCQKMWYLKTNLAGDAEKLIRHFATSDDNYLAAWKTLKDRYDNPRLLVAALVNKLLSQPTHASDKASATTIRTLHDTTQECLMGLENLGVSTTNWDPLLLHMIIKKLDRDTHTLYEQSLSNPRSLQTIKDLLKFLENRFQSLEALGNKVKNPEDQRRPSLMKSVSATTTTTTCIVCKGNHALYACKNFIQMSPSHRLNLLRKHNLCINCLKGGHQAIKCSLRGCTKCLKKHNTLVHIETAPPKVAHGASSIEKLQPFESTASVAIKTVDPPLSLTTFSHQRRQVYVLLSTARVKLAANNGEFIECRAILDSGSQVNLITERMTKRLGLSSTNDTMFIEGIGRATQKTQRRVNVLLESRLNGFSTRVEAFVLSKIISPQPTQPIDTSGWAIPQNIKLADPTFNRPDHIDLLLGAEFYHEFLSIGQIKLDAELPTLQNTVFGWILAGRIGKLSAVTAACGICNEDQSLNEMIERFWKVEEFEGKPKMFTTAETFCENLFNQTVQRGINNRFVVRLPFADDPTKLGESKNIALRRFHSLERKLAKNSELKEQYQQFMDEYLQLGHMEEIKSQDIPSTHYFLPHHCVLKPGSSTTKLRVVFDASAKTSSNISLNDVLHAGPTIQDDLFTILLRFRLPRIVFTADIQKMYRQVLVHDEDRKYQLIIWRKEPTDIIRYYRLNTVTYGTTSAPYLATKCLQKLAHAGLKRYPLGSAALRRDFYVDDVMTGSNSLSIAMEMQKQLIDLLHGAGFKLRKWCANHPQLLQGVLPEDKEVQLDFKSDTEDHIKTLGLIWLPKSDDFCIKTNWNHTEKVTKRIVSSDIARLFDPLGIMAPVIITAKIFLQQLWQIKIDWDAALPQELHTKWINFRNNLKALNHIQFPRHVFAQKIPESTQIHIFADASEKAFGAAIYIRSVVSPGRVIVRLLCAKSRVAPIQKLTLPRLELCAAKLAADLARRVKSDIGFEEAVTHFWTDSEIVLAWINSSSASFHTFVANRVSAIQSLSTPQQWRHVKSKENPADLLSRGIAPNKLRECNLWFYGPLFLHGQESAWPKPYTKHVEGDLEKLEKKKSALTMTATSDDVSTHFIYQIHHGNSFKKLQRVTAYITRFIRLLKRHDTSSGTKGKTPSSQELTDALYTIVKTIQTDELKDDITHLKRYKECKKNSPLSSLTPFLDDRNILRVGGRLEASTLPYDAKHPMLLPYGHTFTKMIMTDIHHENLHVGPQTLLAITRQRFWPIKGKTIARSIVQNCVRCARAKPKLLTQVMGNLPSTRVQPARPFVNSGVDFCGPIWIHYRGRGSRPQKGYVAVFCCFATKAVHLEVVSALSTEAFMGALKRFIGRRGHVRNLYCDNATNFVGARNQLEELNHAIYSSQARDNITSSCSVKGIDFHFIPPRAPHFGGLWEAAVKSAKHLLQRSVSSATMTYEELETLMVEIEAILNSRPLTPMSTDPNDLTALTPGHFLIGEPLTALIDSNAEPKRVSLLTRWKLVTHIKNEFWRRWSKEYLNELQHRLKWKHRSHNLKMGEIVIIKEDNIPPLKWPLGRIVEIHKGEDGHVRVADVRTSSGVLRRTIHKLAPLPCEEENSEQGTISPRDDEVSHHPGPQHKRKAEDSSSPVRRINNDESPKRKVRKSYGSAIVSLLLACLVLPVLKAGPVEVKQFTSQPGLHFEALGTVSLAANEWTLVVYYDLDPYWLEYSALVNGTFTLQHLCNLITHKSSCIPIVNQFNHILDELKGDNELLVTNNNRTRERRGAFNIVGNIANSLFGVLDAEYAHEMSKTIENLKGNEDHLLLLLKNQTSIIDSTLNVIKGDQMAIQEKFKTLDNQLIQIINRLNDDNQNKLTSVFSSLSIQMALIVSSLQRIQSSIINVIIDTNHGKINPLLLSPQQLNKEMMIIRSHIPRYLRLPVEPQDDLLQIYKLMSMKGRIVNNHIIFQLKIPLVNIEAFELFRIFPIPTLSNGTFVAIEPESSYLIISPHRDQYYPLLEQELAACVLTGMSTHLCEQSKPLYRKGANVSACEVDLINNFPLSNRCKLVKIDNNQIWKRLTHPNEWIYALKSKTSINVVCGTEVFSISLEGSGLLKIQPNCVVKHDLLTIQGHHIYLSNARTSYTKLGSLVDIVPQKTVPPAAINSLQYEAPLTEIEHLKEQASSQLLAELPHKINNHDLHQYAVGYIGLALTCAVIIFWLWRNKRSSGPTSKGLPSKPEPLPRRHREHSLPNDEDC